MLETLLIAAVSALITGLVVAWWCRRRTRQHLARQQHGERERLRGLIEGTVGTTGDTYFYALVRELAQFLGMDAAFIASNADIASKCLDRMPLLVLF